MKYVDAEKIITALEKEQQNIDEISAKHGGKNSFRMGRQAEVNSFRRIIDSLQQEQPEVDLEKEIKEHVIYMPHGEFASDNERQEDVEWARKEFRHFYKLGLNARK